MTNSSNQNFTPENQKERWIKYGANVALASVVVIALACVATYLAQKYERRIDTTAAGLYSLKPQTINIIKENKQKIKLVSLYAKEDRQRLRKEGEIVMDYAGPVRDLIEEYARKGKNIEFQAIDPITQPTDSLLKEAIEKYGGAVANYKKFVEETFPATYKQLKDLTGAEAAAVADVKTEGLGDAGEIITTVRDAIPEYLVAMKERLDTATKEQFPDYKVILDRLKGTSSLTDRANLDTISQLEDQLSKLAAQLKGTEKVPEVVRKYLGDSAERHLAIKKLADETIKQIDGLGELKVGDLQAAMKEANLILVLGEKEWRVINPAQVWVKDTRDIRAFTNDSQEIKPRFAGEQAITTAILSLTSDTKQKVVFVRPGGGPLTTPGFPPFQRGGPFSNLAERLRDYNFDVLEKDLSGMYAMQAQMQGQQATPEPTDEDIKNAIWIVLDIPSQQNPAGPTGGISAKVAAHLKEGGAALILSLPESDNLKEALQEYGVEMATDATIVHEPPPPNRDQTGDFAEDVQRDPMVLAVNKYGDHLLAGPVQSLDAILARAVPVRLTPVSGVTQTALLPIPTNINAWGEKTPDNPEGGVPKFDEIGPNADIKPPLFAGAIVEKDKTRLVVIGDLIGFTNSAMSVPDPNMLKRRVLVPRFPGNAELFSNSVFWLARMEPMIAISPSAMQVSRITAMSDGALNFWRVGVLLILLPGMVLAAGIWTYFTRRD